LQGIEANLLEELDVAAGGEIVTARACVRLAFVNSGKFVLAEG
jgi:hypothetical protein